MYFVPNGNVCLVFVDCNALNSSIIFLFAFIATCFWCSLCTA